MKKFTFSNDISTWSLFRTESNQIKSKQIIIMSCDVMLSYYAMLCHVMLNKNQFDIQIKIGICY
jgi:hypothetical protein